MLDKKKAIKKSNSVKSGKSETKLVHMSKSLKVGHNQKK